MPSPPRWTVVPSPVGDLLLTASDRGLRGLAMTPHPAPATTSLRDDAALHDVVDQLSAYFAGELTSFDLPLDLSSGSGFQQRVWQHLQAIPYGTTTSYGAVAADLGLAPGASRAVGLANGRNPVGIVVPCHRVVGSDGALTGYAGGLDRTRWLLTHEATHVPADGARLF